MLVRAVMLVGAVGPRRDGRKTEENNHDLPRTRGCTPGPVVGRASRMRLA